ncbi:MAG: hypothetical protein V3S40_02430 [Kiloniellales bacterium]
MTERPIHRLIAVFFPLLLTAAASPAAAHESLQVTITKADCARLVEHVPAPDVAYQPGVDVYGDPVAPAHAGGGTPIELPETIVIDVEVDLFQRFGIPVDPTRYDADAEVGEVVYRDGRFTFNGQPLHSEAQAELAARCQKIIRDQQ